MIGQKLRDVLKLMAIGAVSFWFPDALWHGLRGIGFSGRDTIALTGLLPLTLSAAYVLLKRHYRKDLTKPIGWPLILGVWLFGGPFMVIGGSFSGGGFTGQDGISGGIKLILLTLIPIFTIDMATYDGSLGALFIVSFAGLLLWILSVAIARKTHGSR
jgi:hypothetical protein